MYLNHKDVHLIPVRMATTKNIQDIKCWKDVEKREPLGTVARDINWYSHYEKHMEAPQKIKNRTTI